MAGKHSSKGNRQSRRAKGRRARAIGLSGSAGAFLALGLGPLAHAPAAHADDFGLDSIIEPIINSLTAADPTLGASLDSWMSSLDTALGAGSAVDAASATDPFASFWQGLEQDWINSPFGGQVDGMLNTWYAQADPAAAGDPSAGACGLICNGVDGTAAHPDGEGGGLWFGNGGDGYSWTV